MKQFIKLFAAGLLSVSTLPSFGQAEIQIIHNAAARELSWFAIRQPAVTGEKSSTRGGAMKNWELVAAPEALVKTEICPVNAFAGTRARTLVADRDTICPGASVEPK